MKSKIGIDSQTLTRGAKILKNVLIFLSQVEFGIMAFAWCFRTDPPVLKIPAVRLFILKMELYFF